MFRYKQSHILTTVDVTGLTPDELTARLRDRIEEEVMSHARSRTRFDIDLIAVTPLTTTVNKKRRDYAALVLRASWLSGEGGSVEHKSRIRSRRLG